MGLRLGPFSGCFYGENGLTRLTNGVFFCIATVPLHMSHAI